MFTIYGAILALCSFLLGFAWGRRVPDPQPSPTLYAAGAWAVSGYDGAYLLTCRGRPIARFASYHKAAHTADLHNGATR